MLRLIEVENLAEPATFFAALSMTAIVIVIIVVIIVIATLVVARIITRVRARRIRLWRRIFGRRG